MKQNDNKMKSNANFFNFNVQKQNMNEFDSAALRCGMNPDEITEVVMDSERSWHSNLKNGKEVATWISYNGRIVFAGLKKAKSFRN